MTKDKIIKFLNNRCTDAELDEIIEWANTEAFSEESVAWGFSDWNEHGKDEHIIDHKRFTDIFDKIQERITVESAQENRKPSHSLFYGIGPGPMDGRKTLYRSCQRPFLTCV